MSDNKNIAAGTVAGATRVVIKIGSALLCGDDGCARVDWLATVADDIAALRKRGCGICCCFVRCGCVRASALKARWANSSGRKTGGIGCGAGRVDPGMAKRPRPTRYSRRASIVDPGRYREPSTLLECARGDWCPAGIWGFADHQ